MIKKILLPKAGALLKLAGISLVFAGLGLIFIVQGLQPAFSEPAQLADPLQKPTPEPTMAQSLTEKERLAERMEAAASIGKDEPARKDAMVAPPLPALVSPAFREGIFFDEPGPFYSGEVLIENLWQGKEAGRFIQVFAGAYAADPAQGVVILLVTSPDRRSAETTWFPTPDQVGRVQILERRDQLLVVGNETGVEFFFDYFQMDFVEAPLGN